MYAFNPSVAKTLNTVRIFTYNIIIRMQSSAHVYTFWNNINTFISKCCTYTYIIYVLAFELCIIAWLGISSANGIILVCKWKQC